MATNWTRAELAIIVEALHENEWTWIRATSTKALDLSELLRNRLVYAEGPNDPAFRSPSSVQRKGENLRTSREGYVGKRTRGSALDLEILTDFARDSTGVLAEAAAARKWFEGSSAYRLPATEDDELAVLEGELGMRYHLVRERSRGLRAKKIASVLAAGSPVACEICGFDFSQTYGPRGKGYIEVHHIRPLHESGSTRTTLADLALVCANCHRVIHRHPWITPAALKTIVEEERP